MDILFMFIGSGHQQESHSYCSGEFLRFLGKSKLGPGYRSTRVYHHAHPKASRPSSLRQPRQPHGRGGETRCEDVGFPSTVVWCTLCTLENPKIDDLGKSSGEETSIHVAHLIKYWMTLNFPEVNQHLGWWNPPCWRHIIQFFLHS